MAGMVLALSREAAVCVFLWLYGVGKGLEACTQAQRRLSSCMHGFGEQATPLTQPHRQPIPCTSLLILARWRCLVFDALPGLASAIAAAVCPQLSQSIVIEASSVERRGSLLLATQDTTRGHALTHTPTPRPPAKDGEGQGAWAGAQAREQGGCGDACCSPQRGPSSTPPPAPLGQDPLYSPCCWFMMLVRRSLSRMPNARALFIHPSHTREGTSMPPPPTCPARQSFDSISASVLTILFPLMPLYTLDRSIKMAFNMGRFMRRFIDREPVVSFSMGIAVFGLSLPFWVTPMREAMGFQTEQYYLPSERSKK